MYVRLNSVTMNWKPTVPALARVARAFPVCLASFIILVAIGLGVSARLRGLDGLQLAIDEYYFVRGVQLILEQGVPLFATGGYYVHGLLAQYAIAASVLIFGENGFGYRLMPVLFSLGSIALFYVYSRRFLEPVAAGLVCAILLISAWHIEFARFIRMYSQLQFFTLLFFIAFQKVFFEDWWRWRYLPHFVAILTFLSHSLGVLLLPFLFVPLLLTEIRRRFLTWTSMATFALASAATVVFCHSFLKLNLRSRLTADPLPEGYAFPYPSRFRLPEFPFWSVSEEGLLNLMLFLAVCAFVVALLSAWRYFERRVTATDIVLALLLVAALFHMFTVVFGLLFLLVFRYRLYRPGEHPRRSYTMLAASFAIGVSWVVYALSSTEWVNLAGQSPLNALRRTFFGWPDFYGSPVFVAWSRELPVLGLMVLMALAYQLVTRLKDPASLLFQNPALIVCYTAICLGVLQSSTVATRYAFFVYPFMVLTAVLSIVHLLKTMARIARVREKVSIQVLAGLACLGLFLWTEDFHARHITDISSERVQFRLGEFEPYANTWYRRSDFESPGRFVTDSLNADSMTKVVVVNLPVVSHYLQRSHAVYYRRETKKFYLVSRAGGTVDVWSNQRLLSTEEELREYTKSANRVLVIRSLSPRSEERDNFAIEQIWKLRMTVAEQLFKSRDNRIEVVSVTLDDPAHRAVPMISP